ncbi:hypothetical protein K8R42_04290 [bacterium]|nr:hypothetical protein [bacterium]
MNISKKKLVVIIIVSVLGLNFIVSSAWYFVDKYVIGTDPDYSTVLTETEMKKVLDDTIIDLRGGVAEYTHTVDDDTNMYLASFESNALDLKLAIEDTTRWNEETWETLTDDPNITWDKFIEKQYDNFVKLVAESASLVKSVNIDLYEDVHHLSKIKGYDVDIGFNEPFENSSNFMEGIETMIGNYRLFIVVEHEQKAMVLNTSESMMEIFMNNLLEAL